jgi:hypothetical protein
MLTAMTEEDWTLARGTRPLIFTTKVKYRSLSIR